MSVRISYSEKAQKQLLALEQKIAQKIAKKIRFYAEGENPLHDAKKLIGQLEGKYRYRIGDYRAIFIYEKEKIVLLTILTINHRKDIYKK